MNNSFLIMNYDTLSEEKQKDVLPILKEREGQIVSWLTAINELKQNNSWRILQKGIFEDLTVKIQKLIDNEAKREEPSSLKLNRLTGQLIWAERYSDLNKLEEDLKVELQGLKLRIYNE